jgi:hypothetical protein
MACGLAQCGLRKAHTEGGEVHAALLFLVAAKTKKHDDYSYSKVT